jgi:hypothetical protein
MPFEIIEATDAVQTRARKYRDIFALEVGQALRIPLTELSYETGDPTGTVRTVAWKYGRRLGRKFVTRRDETAVFVIRRK